MVAVASDITFYLSGGDVNNDPDAALGGVRSDRDITTAILRNLFDAVSSGEASAGDTEYRCVYIFNNNETDSILSGQVWVVQPAAGSVEIGLDAATIGAGKSGGSVAQTITNESTSPTSVTFGTHGVGSELSFGGTLTAGTGVALWIKRIISASASADMRDSVTISVDGSDT